MAKNNNYEEEYEEEVIERDEYIDVPFDAEVEEYDEEYDDYGDEEYYDDEGEYYDDDEEYDDIEDDGEYDEEVYEDEVEQYDDTDERFEQIFEELKQLRAQFSQSQQQSQYQGIYPYAPFPYMGMPFMMPHYGPSPNELNIYNEMARIRDDLTRQNSAFITHKEVSRLQYEMSRDHQRNEDMLNMEIRRLNDRIHQKEREMQLQRQQQYLPQSDRERDRRERYYH